MRGTVIIGITMVLTLTACGNGAPNASGQVAAEPVDRQTIAAATVRVRADGCGPRTELGTATNLGDGLVVTAAHVVAGSNEIMIVDGSGESMAAVVVLFDPELDVAALRTSGTAEALGPTVALRDEPGTAGERGQLALVADDGTIEVSNVEVLQRVTIETTDIYRDRDVERPGLRIDADVRPGDSGAMVHLPGGGVGIVWSRSTATADQAWTVDLPQVLLDSDTRRSLTSPVDTGPCP